MSDPVILIGKDLNNSEVVVVGLYPTREAAYAAINEPGMPSEAIGTHYTVMTPAMGDCLTIVTAGAGSAWRSHRERSAERRVIPLERAAKP